MPTITQIHLKRLKIKWGNSSFEVKKKKQQTNFICFSRMYADQIQRPFGVRYNPYTQSVEVLSSAKRITAVVCELRGDLSIVSSALRKVSAMDQNLDVDKLAQMLTTGLQVRNSLYLKTTPSYILLFFKFHIRWANAARWAQAVQITRIARRKARPKMLSRCWRNNYKTLKTNRLTSRKHIYN